MVRTHMTGSRPPMGVTEETIQAWIDEVLRPWLRVLGAHLEAHPFLFGARPSLADFAVFGASAAHLVNDPLCRRWTEEDGPAVVTHAHRLLEPEPDSFGDWGAPSNLPDTLIALLADLGRLYLPWVSRATVEGSAESRSKRGRGLPAGSLGLSRRGARHPARPLRAYRCEAIDSVLERAGILSYFADFLQRATAVPDYSEPPRPRLNRPFPASVGAS